MYQSARHKDNLRKHFKSFKLQCLWRGIAAIGKLLFRLVNNTVLQICLMSTIDISGYPVVVEDIMFRHIST